VRFLSDSEFEHPAIAVWCGGGCRPAINRWHLSVGHLLADDEQSAGLCVIPTFADPKFESWKSAVENRQTRWSRDSPSRERRKEFPEDNLCAKNRDVAIIDLASARLFSPTFCSGESACLIMCCFSNLALMKRFQRV